MPTTEANDFTCQVFKSIRCMNEKVELYFTYFQNQIQPSYTEIYKRY